MSYMRLFAGRIIRERPIETGTCFGVVKAILLRDLHVRGVQIVLARIAFLDSLHRQPTNGSNS